MNPIWRSIRCVACVAALNLGLGHPAVAQSEQGEPAEKPSPVTTSNPEIPVEHLKLLVKPLTAENLQIEADAWRELVMAKGLEIAERQIGIEETAAAAEEAQEEPAQQEDQAAVAEAAAAEQEGLAEALTALQEERSHLIERLTVVVDALEKKGGEVETYRLYISAVSGLDVPLTDAKTTWTVLKGWLTSEQGGIRWAWNLGKFLVVLIAFYFLASIVAALARHGAARFSAASQLLVNFIGKFVKQVIMLIGFVVALAALEVNIGPLLAAIGAAGFVIAFALQDTLSNFASGMLILAYKPFDVGDVIEAAGVSGIVDSVSLVSTQVRTFDNKLMIVPNNDIWGGTITNATAIATRRVDMTFGIGYEDDVDQAREILERLVKDHELVLDDPPPTIQMNELGESSVNFICRPWTRKEDYWTVYWDITRSVKQEFDRNGISIPFPQRDIHVIHETAAGNNA